MFYPLNRDPLDLIKRYLVAGAVIELSCAAMACAFLERPAGLEIGGDPRGAEGVTADLNSRAEIRRAALNHAPGIDAVHRLFRQRISAASSGAEEGALAVVADAGGLDALTTAVQAGPRGVRAADR